MQSTEPTLEAKPARLADLRRLAFKALSTMAVYAAFVLLARFELTSDGLWTTLSRLSNRQITLLLAFLGLAWLLTEFLFAFLTEMSRMARDGGKSFAALIGRIPIAFIRVIRGVRASLLTLVTHRYFIRRYRRRVYEDYALFNDRGLGLINAARLDLEKVYVELQISSRVSEPRGDLLGRPVTGRQSIWHFLSLIMPGRGLVLLGSPGSGKTTLLQYLLLVFAARGGSKQHSQRLLPIFIELRVLIEVFQKDASPTLATAIRTYWAKDSRISDLMREEPPGWLEQRLHSKQVLLLLDGLDEVPQQQRQQVSDWVERQMRHEGHRHCRFLLTSRPGGYESAPLTQATVLEIQPFSGQQIVEFIDSWYLANELVTAGRPKQEEPIRRHAAEQAADLRSRLRANTDLYELAVNPLLLTMVCMVHRYRGALPGTRSQLYGEICQVLLERWRQAKGISDALTGEQKLAVLRPLAHEFMLREVRSMAEADIADCIKEALEYVGYVRERESGGTARFLRAIQSGSGLLLEQEPGLWSFAHKTFQEYLSSEHWLREPRAIPAWQILVSHDWWREVCLLYAARADVSDLVTAALDNATPASWALAYQCLMESHGIRPNVRARAHETLRSALSSIEPSFFTPAAESLHHLRQLQVRPLSDCSEQRASLVTQVEYQLFLDRLDKNDRKQMLPPHWRGSRFPGHPEEPVLGIWPWQAKEYSKSIGGTAAAAWRLPLRDEAVALEPGIHCWSTSGTLLTSPERTTNSAERDECLGEGLQRQGLVFDRLVMRTVIDALGTALWVDPAHRANILPALACSLRVAVACTFACDEPIARAAALEHGFSSKLIHQLIDVINADIRGTALLRVPDHPVAINWRPPFLFGTGLSRASLASSDQAQRPASYRDVTKKNPRQLLLAALQELADGDESAAVMRNYGECLLGLALPHIQQRRRDGFTALLHTLTIVNGRARGTHRPQEGIVLVRDKSPYQ